MSIRIDLAIALAGLGSVCLLARLRALGYLA
jgi:hypothetical protein